MTLSIGCFTPCHTSSTRPAPALAAAHTTPPALSAGHGQSLGPAVSQRHRSTRRASNPELRLPDPARLTAAGPKTTQAQSCASLRCEVLSIHAAWRRPCLRRVCWRQCHCLPLRAGEGSYRRGSPLDPERAGSVYRRPSTAPISSMARYLLTSVAIGRQMTTTSTAWCGHRPRMVIPCCV